MENRLQYIDIAKGICILLVIIGHCYVLPTWIVILIYSFHMPFFFLIGGYFYKKTGFADSIIRDFVRLIIPYLIFASIVSLKFIITKSLLQKNESIEENLLAILFASGSKNHTSPIWGNAPTIGAIWFLPALFWCRFFFNAIISYLKNPISVMIVGGAVSIIAIVTDNYIINLPFCLLPGMSAVIFYTIGYFHSDSRLDANRKTQKVLFFIISIMCFCITSFQSKHKMEMCSCTYNFYPLDVMAGCGGTIIILIISYLLQDRAKTLIKILSWFGRLSLVVLCMHEMDILIDINTRLGVNNWCIYLFNEMIIIIPLTYLCTKLKTTRKLFQIKN